MKIYISTDLEGISGVTSFDQTRDRGNPMFEEARHLLMGDCNAAVQGCLDGGATEIVVMDGHGGGFNFIPSEMHPGATWAPGRGRPTAHIGLDDTFDAAIFLGYHAMNGTETGVLHHTQSSAAECKYWYNDVESGEIAQSAIVCGHFGVPVVMVTGDDACCAEGKRFLGACGEAGEQIVTVSVKEGYSRESCRMIAPSKAVELIRGGAAKAMGVIGQCRPYRIEFPAKGRLQLKDKETADAYGGAASQRVDERTFERIIESPLDIYRF